MPGAKYNAGKGDSPTQGIYTSVERAEIIDGMRKIKSSVRPVLLSRMWDSSLTGLASEEKGKSKMMITITYVICSSAAGKVLPSLLTSADPQESVCSDIKMLGCKLQRRPSWPLVFCPLLYSKPTTFMQPSLAAASKLSWLQEEVSIRSTLSGTVQWEADNIPYSCQYKALKGKQEWSLI
ncbi:hypothetical protein KC325_g101 [Hortaea werneckii]|nr:hypothetical protein KC325_g101 [Hortaea werneckii]